MEGRGLVPRLLGIDRLPTKSRSHPCARWLVLTCRGWGPPAESCCSHHPFEKHVGPSAPTPQSRPRAEFEKLVLAPAMFPLPASAPQGLSWLILVTTEVPGPLSSRPATVTPGAQAMSPTQPGFPLPCQRRACHAPYGGGSRVGGQTPRFRPSPCLPLPRYYRVPGVKGVRRSPSCWR